MSMTPDGLHYCDRCGFDLGNGGVANCVVVSDLDPDRPGMVRIFEFCRDHRDENGEDVRGCNHELLSPSMLKHYTESQETTT